MIKTLITLSCFHGLALMLEQFRICRPLSSAWNPNVNGSCGNEIVAYVIFEVLGLALDIAIVIQPVYTISLLQFPFKEKLYLISLFGEGSL